MKYLYETHLHTVHSSACSINKGSEYISRYMDLGYSGIIVTDHFCNGNTAISRKLPWQEWVKQFCKGYEEAHNEGERRNFDVFFGWEETFDGCDDYLVYGLDKTWLLEHPEAQSWSRGEQYLAVRAGGGCVVQAHPFRQHHYIRRVILSTGCVDAVEAANAGNFQQSYDALAMRYAQHLNLPMTAGSDIHDIKQFSKGEIFGIYLDEKIDSIAGYVDAVCGNKITGLKTSPGRCNFHGSEEVLLPVDVRDRSDQNTQTDWQELVFPYLPLPPYL